MRRRRSTPVANTRKIAAPPAARSHDAIIFDIDGTLWNACPASAVGWNRGFALLGIDRRVTSAQIEGVAGHPFETCIDLLLPGLRTQYSELPDILNACEIDAVTSIGGTFYDGVTAGIKTLAASYRIFLVSNCQDWYMDLFLGFSGLAPHLAGYDCHGMSGLPKDRMLMNMKRAYSLIRPVYVGDTEGDAAAAARAGVFFLPVSYGFGFSADEPGAMPSFAALLDCFGADKTSI